MQIQSSIHAHPKCNNNYVERRKIHLMYINCIKLTKTSTIHLFIRKFNTQALRNPDSATQCNCTSRIIHDRRSDICWACYKTHSVSIGPISIHSYSIFFQPTLPSNRHNLAYKVCRDRCLFIHLPFTTLISLACYTAVLQWHNKIWERQLTAVQCANYREWLKWISMHTQWIYYNGDIGIWCLYMHLALLIQQDATKT